jgi:hypothetical protein
MISQKSSGLKGKERGFVRNLTSQHLAGRFDNTNDKRVALFMMYTIFAIRLDTLSPRIDTCFIKPEVLLALSKAI